MFFAFCPDGGIFFIGLLFLFLVVVGGVICVGSAVLATIGLAKWAAARHNRLAANGR